MASLVTGASGFVGSWLVRRLVEQGVEVHVLHRANSNLEDLEGIQFVSKIGDVTDFDSVRRAVAGVDTVYHLAGVIGYTPTMRSLMEAVNVGGTSNVIEAIAGSNKKLVYMSSVVAVGASFDGTPLNEESPYNVSHLNLGYFETKHAAEKLVVSATHAGRLQSVILNPATIYGPGDAKKGSRKTQIKVANGKFPFYTSGGVSIVSVHDVVDTLIRARDKGRNGERYILAGENIRIRDLFKRIADIAGVPAPKIYLPNMVVHALGKWGDALESIGRKGPISSENAWTSVLYHWFDHSKAKKELGFEPRPAEDALVESVRWMKENGYLKS
ncbi:MAG: NAD-dependent epimerase/dehydratase family protein [Bdellovibrionales bacterium]